MKLDKTSKFIAQNPDVETKSFSEINDILQLFYEKRAKLKELQTKENLRQINEELFVVNADIKGLERLALKNIKDEELVFIVEVLVSKHKAENIGTKKSLIKAEFERFKMEALRRELEIPLTIRPLSSKNFVQKKQISNEDLKEKIANLKEELSPFFRAHGVSDEIIKKRKEMNRLLALAHKRGFQR